MSQDSEFLTWLADRLVNVYGENPNVDFVHATRRIAAALDVSPKTPAGYLVDPGAGSAMDKFQCWAPSADQLADIERRGGSVTPLYAAPVQTTSEE